MVTEVERYECGAERGPVSDGIYQVEVLSKVGDEVEFLRVMIKSEDAFGVEYLNSNVDTVVDIAWKQSKTVS